MLRSLLAQQLRPRTTSQSRSAAAHCNPNLQRRLDCWPSRAELCCHPDMTLSHAPDGAPKAPFLTPRVDKHEYSLITLENGLKALLVRDSEADKAAAAMDVSPWAPCRPDHPQGTVPRRMPLRGVRLHGPQGPTPSPRPLGCLAAL